MITQDDFAVIATACFALSEALSLIPSVKANGIFQLLARVLKAVAGSRTRNPGA